MFFNDHFDIFMELKKFRRENLDSFLPMEPEHLKCEYLCWFLHLQLIIVSAGSDLLVDGEILALVILC